MLAALPAAAQPPPDPAPPVHRLEARRLEGLRADVAALIVNGREGGALRAVVLAAPAGVSDVSDLSDLSEKTPVDFWVEIDGSRLLGDEPAAEGERPESLRLEVHAYAMTPAGALAGHLSQTVRLVLAALGEALGEGGVKLAGRLELAGGDYELRVLVRERRSQRFVLRILPLTVPAPAGPKPVVSPLLFADPPGSWIQVREAGTGDAEPSAALPVLAVGRDLAGRLRLFGTEAGTPVAVRVLDLERRPLEELEVEIAEPPGGSAELRQLELRFELPELATGNYFLETSVDSASGHSEALLPVYVLGAEWPRDDRELAWTEIRRLSASPERRREALDLAAKRRASKRVKAIARPYRGVLERLAAGSAEEAVDELQRLEIEVAESAEDEARTWLEEAQEKVTAGLAEHGADCLIPVLYLHMEAHDRYVDDGHTLLTFHARERVVALARRYAAEAPSELAASLAASALADMGLSLQWARQLVAARRMLEETLALDERNTVALLNLALHHERRGEYSAAADYLRRLLDLEPRSDEGRLRLALALRRMNQEDEAARLLRRVVDDGTTEWLLTLAYQELGRILLAQERVAEAVRLLEAGVRRLPRAGRLYVQLAYALDRHGESRRGREVLAGAPAAAGAELSPRIRYSHRPQDEQRRDRPSLARQGMARLAILAAALAASEEKR